MKMTKIQKICKDGRIWGQNNKTLHLGKLTGKYIRKGWNPKSGLATRFKKGHTPFNLKGQPRPEISREKNGNWKGGYSQKRPYYNSIKYKDWRKKVFKRDKFTCQGCKIKNHRGLGKSIKLEAHHIKSWKDFPELRFDINNGLTLCVSCHGKTRIRTKTKIRTRKKKVGVLCQM